jgi:DNA-binding NarL/FixJ family response regulator
MIHVLLVDDHAVLRAGLGQLLDAVPDITVVAAASSGEEALELVERLQPDVVLMDLSMPGISGIEATRAITTRWPAVRVVALTSFGDRDTVVRSVDAGAVGYLVKDTDPEDVIKAVHQAARGESPLSPMAATALLRARSARALLPSLTARERDVLALLAGGLSNREIARRLGIREATVKAHLTHVYQVLGVSDRTAAALWAYQQDLGRDDVNP